MSPPQRTRRNFCSQTRRKYIEFKLFLHEISFDIFMEIYMIEYDRIFIEMSMIEYMIELLETL